MPRPPAVPVEEKMRVVLSILSDEMSVAEAVHRNKVFRDLGRVLNDNHADRCTPEARTDHHLTGYGRPHRNRSSR